MIRVIMADKNEITFIKFFKRVFGEFFFSHHPLQNAGPIIQGSVANFKSSVSTCKQAWLINDNFVFLSIIFINSGNLVETLM